MGKSLRALTALSFYLCASVLIVLACISPHWLLSTRYNFSAVSRYKSFGLWHVCIMDPGPAEKSKTCVGLFHKGFYSSVNCYLVLAFFIITQLFMIVTVVCIVIAGFLSFSFISMFRDDNSYEKVLDALGKLLLGGGIAGIIAVLSFLCMRGVFENLSWGYVFAVLGALSLLISGILLLVERDD